MNELEYTDPARELADACQKLATQVSKRGDIVLAEAFGVQPWSREFYEVILSFQERIEFLSEILEELVIDIDVKSEAKGHLTQIASAFSISALTTDWAGTGAVYLGSGNYQPIKMLTSEVRRVSKYPKLSGSQVTEIIENVDQLLEWLEKHQVADGDFIRQALIDGLKKFRFRLTKIGWLGYGYTIESLRDVVSAYMAMERGFPDQNASPDAGAVLKKLEVFLKFAYDKLGFAHDVMKRGDVILKIYGAAAMVRDYPTIVGLLSDS